MLPKCVLPSAKRAGRKNKHRADIQVLCNRWTAGERLELWDETCDAARVSRITNNKRDPEKANQRARVAAIAFAEDSLYGKASRVLSSKGLAPNTEETRRLLNEKHPDQPSPNTPEAIAMPIQLPADMKIRDILRSFPRGTACEPSGLRVENLTDAAEATLSEH